MLAFPRCRLKESRKTQAMDTRPNHGDLDVLLLAFQESREEEPTLPDPEHSLTVAVAVTCTTLRESGEDGPGKPI
jgi:hypothetical protein